MSRISYTDEAETSENRENNAGAPQDPAARDGAAFTTDKNGYRLHCITLVGQIEGHYLLSESQKATKYEHLLPVLAEIEERPDIDGLLILLNTMGGDVEAGLAIAEMIAGMTKPTVSLVLGGGHSIGVPLAVAAKRSFIVPSATMTLHPVRINGLVVGVPQSFRYFNKMQERILHFILDHSNIAREDLDRLINNTDDMATDTGTIIDGKEAVSLGLIDGIGGLSDAIGALKRMKDK